MGKKSGQSSAKSKATKAPKRRGWTSDEQFSYLDSILPTYRGAQTNNTTQEMWGPIEEHWFSHWPLSAPTDAEVEKGLTDHERRKKVMDRIKAWFGNHARDTTTNSETSSKDVLDLRGRKQKKLSEIQVYQKLYYHKTIKDVVEKRWQEKLEYEKTHPVVPPELPAGNFPTVKFRNDISKQLYEAEPESVKRKVRGRRDDASFPLSDDSDDGGDGDKDGEGDGDKDGDGDGDVEEKRRVDEAKRVQRAQKAAVNSLTKALMQIERETQMIGVMILAGPDPELGGSIRVISIGQGKSKMGNSFLDLYGPKWVKQVEEPLGDFTAELYSDETRAALALPGTEELGGKHIPCEYQWRFMSDERTKPRTGFARSSSSVPGEGKAGSRSSAPPATTQNQTEDHPPPTRSSAPPATTRNQTEDHPPPTHSSAPLATTQKEIEDRPPPTEQSQTESRPATRSSAPPATTQSQPEDCPPNLPSAALAITQNETEDHPPNDSSAPPVLPADTHDRTTQPTDTPLVQSHGLSNDSQDEVAGGVRSADTHEGTGDGAFEALADRQPEGTELEKNMSSAPNDSEMEEPEPQSDRAEAVGSSVIQPMYTGESDDDEDEDGNFDGVDEKAWDNGEPLTDDERSHLLTLDTFSRAEEMKRRRRQRMEEEARKVVLERQLSKSPSVPRTTDPNEVVSPQINSAIITSNSNAPSRPSDASLVDIASTHPNRDRWPQWIRECVPELQKLNDSSAWKLLLWEWLEFERALGYPAGKGKKNTLSNINRPREIGEWFQYGRRLWDKQPLIEADKIERFSTDWWKWWADLQPPSRSSDNPLHMPRKLPEDAKWPEAMKGTNNGVYIVLVALGWWGQGAKFANIDMKGWDQAVADVTWVVEEMKLVAEETRKRAREDGNDEIDDSRPKSKRCV